MATLRWLARILQNGTKLNKVQNMKETSLNAIRIAFEAELTRLREIPKLPEERHWEYHRHADGAWTGQFVSKVSFMGLSARHDVNKSVLEVTAALKQDYPKYLEFVGTSIGGGCLQPEAIPRQLAYEAYERFGTFALTGEQIQAILADVSNFFDRSTVRLLLCAPALNLHGARGTPPIAFPGGIALRPITDEECTQFYGGNPIFKFRTGKMIGFPDFVFVKEIEDSKIIGSQEQMKAPTIVGNFQEKLDLCMLALATFKDAGAVGYDGVWITPSELTLGHGLGSQHLYGNEHVPFNHYGLTPEEAPKIEAHAKAFEGIHSTLEMAGQRLVDSARRTKLRDTIVDAVIGLESILLANTGDKTELRFRFSLHYALLFGKEERKDAFHTARDLYDLRSTIAHGSNLKEEVKINGKKLKLGEVATLARSVLRKTIGAFISKSKEPDFMRDDYWTSQELGLE